MDYPIETLDLEPRDGFNLYFELRNDNYTSPDEYDCYTPKQIEAWREDKWHYGIVTVRACAGGVELGSDAIGGVEFGHFLITDDNDNPVKTVWVWIEDLAKDYAEQLIPGAINHALNTISMIEKQIGDNK